MVTQRNNPQTTVTPPQAAGNSTTLQFLFDLDSESCSTQNNDKKIQNFYPKIEELTSIILYCTDNYHSNDQESALKRLKLTQLLSIIKTSTTPFSDQTLEFLFKMLSSNLFRPLPPPSSTTVISPEYDDNDCIATSSSSCTSTSTSTSWPYLQIIYDILLRLIVKLDVKTLRREPFVGRSFILNLLVLFQSGDPRERDAVKNVVHRIYSKFTFYRSCMRKSMTDVLLQYVYELTDHRQNNGIGEILEIWGSIINGFMVPLKEEHKVFLIRVLIPLHKMKNMQVYHRQLVYCVTQFVEKEAEIGGVVIGKILKYWPVSNSHKEVLLIGELEEIVEKMDRRQFLNQLAIPLWNRITKCIKSSNSQVAERALYVWNNEQFLKVVSQELDEVFPILVEAIEKNLKWHWNKNVRELTHNVKTLLEDLEPVLYKKCLEMIEIHGLTTRIDENTRRKRWERIEMAARAKN